MVKTKKLLHVATAAVVAVMMYFQLIIARLMISAFTGFRDFFGPSLPNLLSSMAITFGWGVLDFFIVFRILRWIATEVARLKESGWFRPFGLRKISHEEMQQ